MTGELIRRKVSGIDETEKMRHDGYLYILINKNRLLQYIRNRTKVWLRGPFEFSTASAFYLQ